MEDKNLELLDSITLLYVYNEQNYDEALKKELSNKIKNCIFADSIDSAIDRMSNHDIDILITDFDPKDYLSSLPARIRHINPSCTIIIYTHNQEPTHFLKAIDLKVDKYLLMPTPVDEIMNIVVNCADNAFTLKSFNEFAVNTTDNLSIESYDILNESIDSLRNIIANFSQKYGTDAMQDITDLKNILNNLKVILKRSL